MDKMRLLVRGNLHVDFARHQVELEVLRFRYEALMAFSIFHSKLEGRRDRFVIQHVEINS